MQKLVGSAPTYYIVGAEGKTEVLATSSQTMPTYNVCLPAISMAGAGDNVGQVKRNGTTLTRFYYVKDHLGDTRVTVNSSGSADSWFDYYPYGQLLDGRCQTGSADPRYKYTGKERDAETGYDYFGARYYDSRIGKFLGIDPHALGYPAMSPYCYAGNNPLAFVDPTGMDSIYFQDQSQRPQDNGTKGMTYTATIYLIQDGQLTGVYPKGGSTYPNSVSPTNNAPATNTVDEGVYPFNNQSGNKLGSKKGLNLVNEDGNRSVPGTKADGTATTMHYVNIHEGGSDDGYFESRHSKGCLTISPSITNDFFGKFDWSGQGGNTGTSTGNVFVIRGGDVPLPMLLLPVRPLPRR